MNFHIHSKSLDNNIPYDEAIVIEFLKKMNVNKIYKPPSNIPGIIQSERPHGSVNANEYISLSDAKIWMKIK